MRSALPEGTRPAAVRIGDGKMIEVGPYEAAAPQAAGETRGSATAAGAAGAKGGAAEITLADDEVLLPGLVDTHVHVNEPGRTDWEGFASATRAAAAGGITTIIDMPLNSVPPTTDAGALRAKREAAAGGGGPGSRWFLLSGPAAAEGTAIARVIEVARRTGARAHVLHLSAADAIGLLADARRRGVRVTAETCPHYLALAAEDVPDGATQFKCCPPVRERANRERLGPAPRGGIRGCA